MDSDKIVPIPTPLMAEYEMAVDEVQTQIDLAMKQSVIDLSLDPSLDWEPVLKNRLSDAIDRLEGMGIL